MDIRLSKTHRNRLQLLRPLILMNIDADADDRQIIRLLDEHPRHLSTIKQDIIRILDLE